LANEKRVWLLPNPLALSLLLTLAQMLKYMKAFRTAIISSSYGLFIATKPTDFFTIHRLSFSQILGYKFCFKDYSVII
jgi:hypothetical protein